MPCSLFVVALAGWGSTSSIECVRSMQQKFASSHVARRGWLAVLKNFAWDLAATTRLFVFGHSSTPYNFKSHLL